MECGIRQWGALAVFAVAVWGCGGITPLAGDAGKDAAGGGAKDAQDTAAAAGSGPAGMGAAGMGAAGMGAAGTGAAGVSSAGMGAAGTGGGGAPEPAMDGGASDARDAGPRDTATDLPSDVPVQVVQRRLPLPCKAPLPTGFCLISDMGDYIGQGKTYTGTGPNSVAPQMRAANIVGVRLFDLDTPSDWTAEFASGTTVPLVPSLYDPAQRYPFQVGGAAGLSVTGNGRGCNTVKGKFSVEELSRDASMGLSRFSATFEQHCDGGVPAIRGVVNFQATGSPQATPEFP